LSKESEDLSFEISKSFNKDVNLIADTETDTMDAVEQLKDPSEYR